MKLKQFASDFLHVVNHANEPIRGVYRHVNGAEYRHHPTTEEYCRAADRLPKWAYKLAKKLARKKP